jgi:hypothetical protein
MHTQKKVKCRSEGDMKCFKGFRFILDFQFQRRLQKVKSQANQVKLLRVSFATPCQTVGGEDERIPIKTSSAFYSTLHYSSADLWLYQSRYKHFKIYLAIQCSDLEYFSSVCVEKK